MKFSAIQIITIICALLLLAAAGLGLVKKNNKKPETAPDISIDTGDGAHLLNAHEDTSVLSAGQLMTFKQRLLMDINDRRGILGAGVLKYDEYLTSAAIVRSQEIVENWSHTRPDGSRGMYVVEELGGRYSDMVKSLKEGHIDKYFLGENLAYVYDTYYEGWADNAKICEMADKMFDNWVNSPAHYSNMISKVYTGIGLGVTVTLSEDENGKKITIWCGTLYSN